jgi:UDP-N-acetylmuramyl pentapeptide phosphotransferase/UDP-N-acetylglucosamine-1-phosphate transferase
VILFSNMVSAWSGMALAVLAALGLAFAISLVLTRLMISAGPRMGLMDTPGERRIHKAPIPRAGGIAVWLAFLAGGAVVLAVAGGSAVFDWEWFRAFALASGILVAIGIVDDRGGISPWLKLAGQVLVAVLLFFTKGSGVGSLMGYQVPVWLDLLVWVAWTVALINAFNLIDGMDGLCAGLAAIAIGSLAVLSFAWGRAVDGLVMVAMLGAVLGFLRYNFHPARIFLGDAGSMFLGLFIASAGTVSAGERAVLATVLLPLLVAGVPLFDVVLAVWRRAARRWMSELGVGKAAKVFGADREHLHHRLISFGLTQRKVAAILYALALGGVLLAVLPTIFDERAIGITVVALVVAALLGFRYLAPVELHASGAVLDLALKRPAKGRLISLVYFIYDAAGLGVAFVLAFLVEFSGRPDWLQRPHLLAFIAIAVACGLIGLRMAKAQSRHWARAGMRDFWALFLWLGVGLLFGFTLTTAVDHDLAWSSARVFLIGTLLSGLILSVPRSLTHLLREAAIDSVHRRMGKPKGERPRIMLYGAGDLGELFLAHLKTTCPARLSDLRIMGFMDDHPHLRGRLLDGFRVHGGVDQLTELHKQFHLQGVVLTLSRLDPERAAILNEVCAEHGLTIYRWRPFLELRKITSSEVLEDADGEVAES